MSKYTNLIWIIIIGLFIFMVWPIKIPNISWGDSSKEQEIIKNNESKIDSLKKIIESNKKIQIALDNKILNYQDSISSLKNEIFNRENKIKELKKESNEIHSIVSKFSTSDINKFLSDRYKDSLKIK